MSIGRRAMRCHGVLVSAVAIACGGVSMAPDPPGSSVPVTRLRAEAPAFTFYSGLTGRERLIVRDPTTWKEVWDRISGGTTPAPDPPPVDFAREMLIVAALGERSTGGYGIVVDSVETRPEGLLVTVRTIAPGKGCVLTQALTQPVDIARVPRHDGQVAFEDRTEVRDCS
jgi:hypothetical protein